MNIEMRNKVNKLIHVDGYYAVKSNDMYRLDRVKGKLIALLKDSNELKTVIREFDRTMYYYYNTLHCV